MHNFVTFLRESWRVSAWLVVVSLVMTLGLSWAYDYSMSTTLYSGALTLLIWQFLWLGNGYLSDWLDLRISWQSHPVRRFVAGIAGMLVYSVGIVYLLILFFRHVIGFDPGDDLDGMFFSTLIITTLITMFMTSRSFLFNWRQAAVDAEQLKRESVKAQYESLRNQVNPHFLFNSLNALTNLVYQDPNEAARFIKQLADVYRYVLDTRDKEVVRLEDELNFLNAYLFLQQIRFGDKLKLDVLVANPTGSVAPLALQLLVENAIKHNIIAETQPLFVQVTERDGRIWVSNTLQRKPASGETSSGLGLENIRKRYSFLSNKPVEVLETAGTFSVGLPVLPPLL